MNSCKKRIIHYLCVITKANEIMRKNNLSKWSITPDIDGMLYFAQRIDEMLFDYSLDTYKGRLFNSFMLCAEALDCINKMKTNLISSQNLSHIIEELNWSLENDKVIDALLKNEKSLFYPLKAQDSFENLEPILELLSIRILPTKYEAKCRELLINHIKANKKKAIDSLLESWLCLIKVWGYSDEWIYHYSNNYFFNSTNNIDNIAYLDGFFNSFQFKSKEYDAYLIVNKILRTVITNSEFNRNFVICDNIPAEIGGEKAKFQRRKTEKDIYVKWHIPKCFDIYSARESAIHAIDNLRDLFAFFHHKVKPQIQEAILIVEKGTTIGYCVDKQTPPIAKGSDAYVNVATQKLNKLLNGIIPATDTMEKIDSVMNLHSLCVENSNPTNQLLNLWTAIEIIIPINPQKGGDKIQQIAGTLGKALTLGYCHRIFFDVFKSAKQWNNPQLISYINNVPERVGTQFERFVAFIIFPEYEEYRKQLATELSDYPLLRHRLHFLNQNYSTIKDITKILTKHEKKLGWHLRRLYRARNSIVHGSSHVFFIENLITNLHTYIDEFTSLILMLVQDKQSITTIEQGVKYINLAYDHKMSIIKKCKNNPYK